LPPLPFGRLPQVLPLTSGVPLESALRARLEPWLGFALGGVRLHTDSAAASLARQLRAQAFTVGRHVFFAAGHFQPQTRRGLGLLVHELTHVGQQPGGGPLRWGQLTLTQHRVLEQEAHAREQAVLARAAPPPVRGMPGGFSLPGGAGELPAAAVVPRTGGEPFPPLLLSWASRTMAVAPLRQEAMAAPAAPTPTPAAPPGAAPLAPRPAPAPDPEQLAQRVYEWIQRRLRFERERRGIQQWY
jgi:hypothetical protein